LLAILISTKVESPFTFAAPSPLPLRAKADSSFFFPFHTKSAADFPCGAFLFGEKCSVLPRKKEAVFTASYR